VSQRFLYDGEEDRIFLYCAPLSINGKLCALFLFLVIFSLQAWYYAPLLAVIAVSAEPLVEQFTLKKFWRVLFLLAIAVSSVTALVPAKQNLTMRMTSMDLVASIIEQEARADDLVILNPWYLGVSFNRYYQGAYG
jgi:hypothetical protein